MKDDCEDVFHGPQIAISGMYFPNKNSGGHGLLVYMQIPVWRS